MSGLLDASYNVELARRVDGVLAVLEQHAPLGGADVLRRAGSPQEGFALLFASPAFQWRV